MPASAPAHTLTKEELFKNKIQLLGLRTQFKERTREQYGVTQYRLEIRILRGEDEVAFTTGGFWDANSYRESAFEQGLRKLIPIEQQMGCYV